MNILNGAHPGLLRGVLTLLAATLLAPAIAAGAAAVLAAGSDRPLHVRIDIHYSHYEPASFTVPVGRPVEIEIHNLDPIDHEWIVGNDATHERHRTGTEPHHGSRPTEVSIDALSTVTTTVTFISPGQLKYICHLPGHEAYGMVGVVTVTP